MISREFKTFAKILTVGRSNLVASNLEIHEGEVYFDSNTSTDSDGIALCSNDITLIDSFFLSAEFFSLYKAVLFEAFKIGIEILSQGEMTQTRLYLQSTYQKRCECLC